MKSKKKDAVSANVYYAYSAKPYLGITCADPLNAHGDLTRSALLRCLFQMRRQKQEAGKSLAQSRAAGKMVGLRSELGTSCLISLLCRFSDGRKKMFTARRSCS